MFQKRNISKVKETDFSDWFRSTLFVFFLKSTSSCLGKLEAFMACTSMSWGCWKLPIRAAQAPLGTGSASEKPAAPESKSLTQSVNTVLGWSNRSLISICSLWDWGRQGVLVLVIESICYRVAQDIPITAFLGDLAFGDYGVYVVWFIPCGLLLGCCLIMVINWLNLII